MTSFPEWLAEILSAATSPMAACENLLFHGTLERFSGRLAGNGWEGLRWAAETPVVAQSYCPETGGLTGWSAPTPWELSQRMLPNGEVNKIIFRELGFNEDALDLTRDQHDRIVSWRILPGHPSWSDACSFLESLGYDTQTNFSWIKIGRDQGKTSILPASHKEKGRLFILERPADLRIFNYADRVDGGLSGRQWNHTDIFKSIAAKGDWDGVEISDIHQTRKTGHFSHNSIGLFEPTLARLRYHVIDITHVDPSDCWERRDENTTPEFDALWASCRRSLAA